MESLVIPSTWARRSVFLTGHTGFKGGWLAHWLDMLDAKVHGFARAPVLFPSGRAEGGQCFFDVAEVAGALASDQRGDLADLDALRAALQEAAPSVVFHLAAQALVPESYTDPLGTFASNVIGTAHLLESVRHIPSVQVVIVVTTDKVYENPERNIPFAEGDPLGGEADPYSASKAAAEIAVATWRRSFLAPAGVAVASVRAGNVIGGGDWTPGRLVPDCLAAFAEGRPVILRYPDAVRPWQHVLDPLGGYLMLADRLLADDPSDLSRAWNFGPDQGVEASVRDVVGRLTTLWGPDAMAVMPAPDAKHPHEMEFLRLDSRMAQTALDWHPRFDLKAALTRTIAWQRAYTRGEDMVARTRADIAIWNGSAA